MSFELYERVKIKKNGVTGQIVDISERESRTVYIVESDTKGNAAMRTILLFGRCTIASPMN